MAKNKIIFYDYDHCRDFLETRAKDLRESTQGLESLATYREMLYSFSYEALEQSAVTLGQFDATVVYCFVPESLPEGVTERTMRSAEAKALDMLQSKQPPLAIELLSAQARLGDGGERGRIESWMRPEFLRDIVNGGRVEILLFFDGAAFFEGLLRPQLQGRGFVLADSYESSGRSGMLRVRHPGLPGKFV